MVKKQKENLSGFSWHIGYATLKEGEDHRHKSRCIHYMNDKKENHCRIKNERCIGSSHCRQYKEKSDAKECESHKEERVIDTIPCSIPLSEFIETKKGKMGILVKYKNKVITLLIDGEECDYSYPNAFWNGYLKTTVAIEKCISNDLRKAVWK